MLFLVAEYLHKCIYYHPGLMELLTQMSQLLGSARRVEGTASGDRTRSIDPQTPGKSTVIIIQGSLWSQKHNDSIRCGIFLRLKHIRISVALPRAAPAVQAARPQPPILSVRCGASRALPAASSAGRPLARGVRADPRRGQQRAGWQQGGMGWADAVGGKGRLIFLYSVSSGQRGGPVPS